MDNNFIITCFIMTGIIIGVVAAGLIAHYLWKSIRLSKGNYGKQTVKSILSRFAAVHKYRLLENVEIEFDDKTQTIDFVLVGFFGLLFVSALQGKGDFYGDFKEKRWTFADEKNKVLFDNPVMEMDKKLELFRRLMAQKKVYNLKVDTAVVVVSSKADVPMYLSNVREENPVMTVDQFHKLLGKEKFEQDNNVDVDTVCGILKGTR